FFQAEDGIRAKLVTGVQTCALPISLAQGPGAVEVSTGDEGGPITNGATNAGSIYQGDFDTWTFTATQGDYIALSVGTVTQTTAHFAPWIRLVSPSGEIGRASVGKERRSGRSEW